MLRMRVYMAMEDWNKAIAEGEAITGYEVAADVTELYGTDTYNSKEIIFALPMSTQDRPNTQQSCAEFFSKDTAREMLVPYVKEAVEYAHSLGMYVDLHCCGFVEGFVPFFIEEGFNSWGGQPLNDKPKLKKMYPGKFIFTHTTDVDNDASDEEIDKAVAKFMDEFGYDNRGYFGGTNERFRKKLYEASRKNYDRLVAEGKAIL